MQDIKKDWESHKKKDLEWANKGVFYAKSLRKEGSFSDAISVCEAILSVFPDFRKAINQYGWNLYSEFIKSSKHQGENDPRYEVANRIISMFRHMEPYTPYIMVCLSSAEWSIQEGDFNVAIGWLSKVDENGLSKDELEYRVNNRLMYWSQLRKYLELSARYFASIENFDDSIRTLFRILHECRNSSDQVDKISSNIYSNIACLYQSVDDEELVDSLLVKRGFTNSRVRKTYKTMLQRRFQEYVGWQEDRPIFNTDIYAIVLQLAKELFISLGRSKRPSVKGTRKISATALSNFTFCPASYSLQETYDFGNTELGNIGTMMHDKQLLLSRKMEETKKGFYLFSTQKKPNYFDSLALDDDVKQSILPLIQDISTSTLVFHGHNRDELKLFYDDTGTLVGSPDYIFEKTDGTRFVIEEKFSFQKRHAKSISKPYSNHLIQLGSYTTLLREIRAAYGYILYWSYSFENGYTPCVSKAQAFRIDNSEMFEAEIFRVVHEVKDLNSNGRTDFNINTLNPWKCVNCVTTDRCMHKTGNTSTLSLPYR